MKFKLFLNLIVAIALSSECLSAEKLSYGFKAGINYNKINYKKGYIYVVEEYSYPTGFQLGVFLENKVFGDFVIVNEINFLKLHSKMHIMDDTDIFDQDIKLLLLNCPILLRYDPPLFFAPYLFVGPSFGYLISAKCSSDFVFAKTYSYDDYDITEELPSINASLEFGVGKAIKVSIISFLFELR